MLINNLNYNYIGFTVNPNRRLKQHNKELKGGAKYTSKYSNWNYLFIIEGFKTKQEALQCEWKLKHPNNKYISSYKKRIENLNKIFKIGNKFTSNTINSIEKNDIYIIYINKNYKKLFDNLKFDDNIILIYINMDIYTINILFNNYKESLNFLNSLLLSYK